MDVAIRDLFHGYEAIDSFCPNTRPLPRRAGMKGQGQSFIVGLSESGPARRREKLGQKLRTENQNCEFYYSCGPLAGWKRCRDADRLAIPAISPVPRLCAEDAVMITRERARPQPAADAAPAQRTLATPAFPGRQSRQALPVTGWQSSVFIPFFSWTGTAK